MRWPRGFLTTGKLRERGWTAALIARFMPEPDDLMDNPVHRSAPPIRLYGEYRVRNIECTPEWKAAAEAAGKRRAAGKCAAATKREKLLAAIESLKIEVPYVDRETLTLRACSSYNSHKMMIAERRDWNYEYTPATPDSSPEFLERITVNYLRHNLTHYERELARVHGKVGVREAKTAIRRRVYAAISTAYPELQAECEQQMRDREQMEEAIR